MSSSGIKGSLNGIGGFVYKNPRFGQETSMARIGWYSNDPAHTSHLQMSLVDNNSTDHLQTLCLQLTATRLTPCLL